MVDVLTFGELLVDFIPAGFSSTGQALYEENAGGAPANVAVAVARLGGSAAFMGMVGEDHFGHFLRDTLLENRVGVEGLRFNKDQSTTLAFVHLDQAGERSFSFLRKPGADTQFCSANINYRLLDETRLFHFGSLSLTNEPVRSATLSILEYAIRRGIPISFDPNLRENLWADLAEAKQLIELAIKYSNIIKVSEEELLFLTGETNLEKGLTKLKKIGGQIFIVTLGSRGSMFLIDQSFEKVGALQVKPVDTTGAGDGFMGGLLYQITRNYNQHQLKNLTQTDLALMVKFANIVGALVTTKKGAITAMPSLEEVESCLNL